MEGKLPSSSRRKEYLPRRFHGVAAFPLFLGCSDLCCSKQQCLLCCPCLAAHPRQNRHFSPPEGPMKRGDHNAFTLYHPTCFLLACFTPFFLDHSVHLLITSLLLRNRHWGVEKRCPLSYKQHFKETRGGKWLEANCAFNDNCLLFICFYSHFIFFFRLFQVRTYVRAYR